MVKLQEEYQTEADVAREIDRTIHRMYKLWPSNYIAYDEYMGSREYSSNYSIEQRSAFLRRFHEEPLAIRSRVLAMYAQPIINRRSLVSERELTYYLKLTKEGNKVIVTDRGTPVAILQSIDRVKNKVGVEERLASLAKRGMLRLPLKKGKLPPFKSVEASGKPTSEIIIEERR